MRRPIIACCTILLGAILSGGAAGAEAPMVQQTMPKPSSVAPHPGNHQRAYGTPIQSPILHRRKPTLRSKPSAAPADTNATTS